MTKFTPADRGAADLARMRGIKVGAIDGRLGPQSRYAFEAYDARKANGWKPVPTVEDWRGNSDETMPPVPASHPLVKNGDTVPRVASPKQSRVPDFYVIR